MRFWQKSFLCVLIVFLIAFDIGAYALLQKSYQLNEQMDMERGKNELEGIAQSMSSVLKSYNDTTAMVDFHPVISGLAENYYKNGVYIEVFDKDTLIFSNTYILSEPRGETDTDHAVYRKIDGKLFLYTAGQMDFMGLGLIVSRNADYLQEFYNDLLRQFMILSIIMSCALSLILILILLRLTSPMRKLNSVVNSFTRGHYTERASTGKKDEIGELSENFNKMADSVESSIEKLNKESELKEIFINNLTHELKTPITAIKGYSEFIKNTNCSESDKQMATDYIIEHITRLDTLSSKLMELLYAKNESLAPVLINIEELFNGVIQLALHKYDPEKISIQTECIVNQMYGDAELLQTLLLNLVENSVKAIDDAGLILLRSYTDQENLVLEIEDNGKGIPHEDILKITEAFYVVDKSRSRKMGGIGLGLSICSQIIELHNAKLRISSTVGIGTKVSVYFTTNLQLKE